MAAHMAVRAPWAGLFQVALTSAYGPVHMLESLKKKATNQLGAQLELLANLKPGNNILLTFFLVKSVLN